jgi:Mg/Co/Ni transporter MgtE
MLSNLEHSVKELDKKFGVTKVEEIEEKEKHILFDFMPEDLCIDFLKYLEKNYQGTSIKTLSSDFSLTKEEVEDYLEILLNYGLIFEKILKREKLYSLNDGAYYKFVQEIK